MSTLTSLQKSRIATVIIFFCNGFISANWISRIPSIKEGQDVSAGILGLALFGMPGGLLVGATITPWLVSQFGDKNVILASILAYCLFLPLLGLAPNPLTLFFVFFLMGISAGALDVSMNIQAAAVEKLYQKPIMSSFHALFSLGGLVGALAAGLLVSLSFSPPTHLFLTGTVIAIASLFLGPLFLKKAEGESGPIFVMPNRSLLALGVIAFCALLSEGAIGDWGGVYLRENLKTNLTFAAFGYGAFSLFMATGRFAGDAINEKIGRTQVTRLSGIVSLIGIILVVLLQNPLFSLLGFGLVGLGFATVFPNIVTAAGNNKSMPQNFAIASVTTLGYFGFLLGPPLIGLTAEFTSLRIALSLLSLTSLFIILLAREVK